MQAFSHAKQTLTLPSPDALSALTRWITLCMLASLRHEHLFARIAVHHTGMLLAGVLPAQL